jgi:hypothetical protein
MKRSLACAVAVSIYLAPTPSRADPSPTETAPLEGTVLQKGTRVPLSGVTVAVKGAPELETITTDDGQFAFPAVPVGKQVLLFRGATISAFESSLEIAAHHKTTATFYFESTPRYQSTVHGKNVVPEVVSTALDADEIRRIPGTQGDLLRSVQNLPGVARAPFGSGLLPVWGSSPEDTRSYVDGVYIPTLYHFFGLRSTVSSEMVSGLSFTPGGFAAEFGRATGGLIQVETRAPRDDGGVHGFLQLDAIDVSTMIEAKLPHHLSLAVAFRRSVLDWVRALPLGTYSLQPSYYDYQLKLNWKPSGHDEIELFIFGSDDQLELLLDRPNPLLTGQFDSHIWYVRALGKWIHRFSWGTLTSTSSVGYEEPFQIAGGLGNNDLQVNLAALTYTSKLVLRVPLASWLHASVGLDYEGFRWDVSAQAPVQGTAREGDNSTLGITGGFGQDHTIAYQNLAGAFASLTFSFFNNDLVIAPSLRVELYDTAGYLDTADPLHDHRFTVEPRLYVRGRLFWWLGVKAAIGVYQQPPDVTAFSRIFGSPNILPPRAIHYVFGFEFDPTSTLHIEAVGFYKDLGDLIVRDEKPGAPQLSNEGVGRVYGGDLMIRQQLWKNFFGWLSYTISRSERRDHPDDPWRIFQYDQTHILTLVASYKLPRNYQIGIRFRYVTGNPDTAVVDRYFDGNTLRYTPVYGPTYGRRLSDFHQLDIRVDKTWTFDRFRLSVYLDVENVYYYRSEEGLTYNYDYTRSAPVQGLPIIPALGMRGEF